MKPQCESAALTPTRLPEIIELVQTIARGVEVGHTGRLRDIPRQEMMARCRDACDRFAVGYSLDALKPARTDKPRDLHGQRGGLRVIRSKNRRKPHAPKSGKPAVRSADVASRQDRNARPGDTQAES